MLVVRENKPVADVFTQLSGRDAQGEGEGNGNKYCLNGKEYCQAVSPPAVGIKHHIALL